MDRARTIVALAGVTKRYDAVLAVDRLDLEVRDGEFLALLGPSGCGKTTTLRMIAGFEEPTEGEIVLDDAPVVGVPPHKRQVNTVFQQYALFPHMSVLDNVAYGLKQRGVGRRERREEAARMLASVHLEGREHARPNQLSGGQQQRVALARALVMRPKVLLLDEPLGSLDQKLRKAMQIELKRLQAEVGITFVFVTHDQDEAMTMADRIAVMDRGRIEQLAAPSALYDEPATEFVAHFIGDISELRGVLAGDEVALDGGGRVPVGRRLVDVANGARVRVGLRPEGAVVVPGAGAPEASADGGAVAERSRGTTGAGRQTSGRDAGPQAGATVVTAMVLGDRLQLVVRLGDGQELLLRQPRRDGDEAVARLAAGDRVGLAFALRAGLLLAAVEGEATAPVAELAGAVEGATR